MNNLILRFLNWYCRQCNGIWEHNYGVRIESTKEPIWEIYISIQETDLQFKSFEEISVKRDKDDWLKCDVHNGFFTCHCAIGNLPEGLNFFCKWADNNLKFETDENLQWLIKWFQQYFNDSWENNGIRLKTIDNPGWILEINLSETAFEDKSFKEIVVERSANDWIHVSKKNKAFFCACGPLNVTEALHVFRSWIEENSYMLKEKTPQIQWESVKRYDGNFHHSHEHYNKITKTDIPTPHVHDPKVPGGIRVPEPWENP